MSKGIVNLLANAKPSLEVVKEITKQLDKVPYDYKELFLNNMVILLKSKTVKSDIRIFNSYCDEIVKQFKIVFSQDKSIFLKDVLVKMLELKPDLYVFKEITKLLGDEFYTTRVGYFSEFIKVLRLNNNKDIFKEIVSLLKNIEPSSRKWYLKKGIVDILKFNPSLDMFKEITKEVSKRKEVEGIYGNVRFNYLNQTIKTILKQRPSSETFRLALKIYNSSRYVVEGNDPKITALIYSFIKYKSNAVEDTNVIKEQYNSITKYVFHELYNGYKVFPFDVEFQNIKKEILKSLSKSDKTILEKIKSFDLRLDNIDNFYKNVLNLLNKEKVNNSEKRKLLTKLKQLAILSKQEINKLEEKIKDINKKYKEGYDKLSKGIELKDKEEINLVYGVILSESRINYDENLENICKKLKISYSKNSVELIPKIMEKLKEYNPDIKIKENTSYYKEIFLASDVTLKIPESLENILRDKFNKLDINKDVVSNKILKLKNEIKSIEKKIVSNINELSKEYNLPRGLLNAYKKGSINTENILGFIFKNRSITEDVVSMLLSNVLEHVDKENFYSFLNGNLDKTSKNKFINTLFELDMNLEDYLKNNGLFAIYPKIRSSEIYESIKNIRQNVSELKHKVEKDSKILEFSFNNNRDLLDVFSGKFSGTCFGDHPEDMIRKELFIGKCFKDGDFIGGITNIIREVDGKKSLVIAGVDVSESFTSSLSQSKKEEFIDLLISKQKKFCEQNNLGLYITTNLGGISNRSGFSEYIKRKYVGRKYYNIDKITIHPSLNYTTTTCNNIK